MKWLLDTARSCAEQRTGPPQRPEGFDSRLRPPPSGKAANEVKAMKESGITQADGESFVAACFPEAARPGTAAVSRS